MPSVDLRVIPSYYARSPPTGLPPPTHPSCEAVLCQSGPGILGQVLAPRPRWGRVGEGMMALRGIAVKDMKQVYLP